LQHHRGGVLRQQAAVNSSGNDNVLDTIEYGQDLALRNMWKQGLRQKLQIPLRFLSHLSSVTAYLSQKGLG
jgi:hypothetical protein